MSQEVERPILEVSQVSKRFDGMTALESVDFHVYDHEIVGLIGPNGAGKTTLFNVISGFETPDEGLVTFKGKDITKLSPDKRCKLGITRTFQMTKPFRNLSVAENVTTAALNRNNNISGARREAETIIEKTGLKEYTNEKAGTLSTGYQKRLELARALATKPRLLLLDEVFAGLSETAVYDIIGILKRVNESGTAIVIVEHLMPPLLMLANRVVALDHGIKVSEGHTKHIVADGDISKTDLRAKNGIS
jgi:branched-chain amino acid transport system ATP-binding protein